MLACLLELGSILVNKSLQSKYWEQEVIAIKKAYSKQGMRSTNPAKAASIDKAKHQKQVILRSLQLEMVAAYLLKVASLAAAKQFALVCYAFFVFARNEVAQSALKQIANQKGDNAQNLHSLIDFVWQLESQDLMGVICVVGLARLVETGCILAVWRWKANIKRDVDQFNLATQQNKQRPKMQFAYSPA